MSGLPRGAAAMTLVVCTACAALRSDRVSECFCGERAVSAAPPAKPDPLPKERR